MFTTFVGMAPSGATHLSPETPKPPKPRQKRSQVARACDWCRMHRIKCDNHLPCLNCRKRKGQCSQGEIEIRTLPHAYRKIEELESRVRELEQELEKEREARRSGIGLETPDSSPSSLILPCLSGPKSETTLNPPSDHGRRAERNKSGEGVRIRTARSRQETWYGPSSLFYFIRRVNTFLNNSLRETRPISRMLPDSNKLFDGPTQTVKGHGHQPASVSGGDQITIGDFLTPTQEEYFIGLFWQSFQTAIPVLDEVAFKEHYQSLWTPSSKERKPSALVDIVIALCMQYGVAQHAGGGSAAGLNSHTDDAPNASIVGRWYYQRCQSLLTSELETPTIFTLQCHILSTTYLCAGSFPNMADSTCTLAVRTAYMLGLHLDPPEETPQRERELRKRLWWTLYVFESNISMKLGRPFLLDHIDTTCSLPRDDQEIAMSSGSSGSVFTPLGEGVTWLTFHVENDKLFRAVRAAYTAFYKRQSSTTNPSDDQVSRDDSEIIESHAEFLGPYLDRIGDWVKNVPSALQTKRRDNGVPFSTDFTALEIEPFESLWLQRQRLLLELMYHNLCINLFRPFIRFNPAETSHPTPFADKLATRCAAHAIALTHTIHQVLTSTSILTGWHESFQWQWNATMTLIGFAIAYPQHTSAPAARHAIDLSVTTFEIFARSLPTATSAAAIARDLGSQIDVLTKRTCSSPDVTQQKADGMPLSPVSWGVSGSGDGDVTGGDSSTSAQPELAADIWGGDTAPMWAESIDMAFSVDTEDFGMLYWPDMSNDLTVQWTFPDLQM
ncbi:fungal-specific transcription factor domain-containing protein [Hypoxylon sp. FL1857]|nr:fungal-specific transcription factor domain-containing protein [Hypoxylon sp. FL1857]